MYKITIQTLTGKETTIYYPGDPEYTVSSAVITYEIGLAGEFNFAIPVTNPAYDLIVRNAIITVYENDKEIWRGDIRNIKTNFDKSLSVYVVEDLAWLGEEPAAMVAVTNQTYAQRFNAVMSAYNSNQAIKRQFQAGQLTAQTSSSTCFWEPEYGDSVLSGLRKFIAKDNGYLKVRRVYESNTKGLTITFDSRTDTESTYDYLEIYYKLSNKWYKRTLSGSIGDLSVYVPTPIFYLHWHSDNNVQDWGWKINSIEITDSGTPEDFSQSSLPYAFWVEIYSPDDIPESSHYYSANEDKYYKFMLWQNYCVRYIDIVTLADYGKQSTQRVEFGSNMINFLKDMDVTNLCNALYPYGAETETELYNEVMQRIAGTPIQNNDSITVYGRRAKTVVFDTDSTTVLNNLASSYLSRYSQPSLTLEIQAADLNGVENVDAFAIGDSVRVVASVYAIDQWIYITQLDVNLLDKAQNHIKLSDVVRSVSLTSQVTTQIDEIKNEPIPMSILDAAKKNAFAILEGDNGGIVTLRKNDDDQIVELVIANNMELSQATKAWRWNLNGLAYLHRTYPSDDWTVGIAATMDGGFVADFITTGTLTADIIKTGTLNAALANIINLNASNITTGYLTADRIKGGILLLGGYNNIDGRLLIMEGEEDVSAEYTINPNSGIIFTLDEGNAGDLYVDVTYYEGWTLNSVGEVWKNSAFDCALVPGENHVFSYLPGSSFNFTVKALTYTIKIKIIYRRATASLSKDGLVASYINALGGKIGSLSLQNGELYSNGNILIYEAEYTMPVGSSTYQQEILTFKADKLGVIDSTYKLTFNYDIDSSLSGSYTYNLSKFNGTYWTSIETGNLETTSGAHSLVLNTEFSNTDDSYYWLATNMDGQASAIPVDISVLISNTKKVSISSQGVFGKLNGSFTGTADLSFAKIANVTIAGNKITGNYSEIESTDHPEIYLKESNTSNIRINRLQMRLQSASNTYCIFRGSADLLAYRNGTSYYIAWTQGSDERIKENIEPLDYDLSRGFIDATRTKRFKYKGADGIHYGMIAQEARELLDNLGESDAVLEFGPDVQNDDVPDYRAIHYEEYIPHLINYVKDLRAELVALKEEVRLLKEEKVNG